MNCMDSTIISGLATIGASIGLAAGGLPGAVAGGLLGAAVSVAGRKCAAYYGKTVYTPSPEQKTVSTPMPERQTEAEDPKETLLLTPKSVRLEERPQADTAKPETAAPAKKTDSAVISEKPANKEDPFAATPNIDIASTSDWGLLQLSEEEFRKKIRTTDVHSLQAVVPYKAKKGQPDYSVPKIRSLHSFEEMIFNKEDIKQLVATLELPVTATLDAVRKRASELTKHYHADKQHNKSEEERRASHEACDGIQKARKALEILLGKERTDKRVQEAELALKSLTGDRKITIFEIGCLSSIATKASEKLSQLSQFENPDNLLNDVNVDLYLRNQLAQSRDQYGVEDLDFETYKAQQSEKLKSSNAAILGSSEFQLSQQLYKVMRDGMMDSLEKLNAYLRDKNHDTYLAFNAADYFEVRTRKKLS